MRALFIVFVLAACGGKRDSRPAVDAEVAALDDAAEVPRSTGVEAGKRAEHALNEVSQLVAAGRATEVKATCELNLEVTRGALAAADSPIYKKLEAVCVDKVYPAALEHDLSLIRQAAPKDDTLVFECEKDRAVWETVKAAAPPRSKDIVEAFGKACAQPWASAGSLR